MNTSYKIKLTLKGILFYVTIIAIYLFVAGIDSIYDEGHLLISTVIVASLIYACYKLLDKEDIDKLTLKKYISKEKPEEEDEW